MTGAMGKIRDMFMRSLTVLEQTRPEMDMEDAEYVVFDTELTGLDTKRDSIVSIGAVKMAGGRILLGQSYYRVVAPRTAMKGQSVCIHGITPGEAALCPEIDTLMPEFLEFCGNRIVVGHFVGMDLKFINNELKRLYGTTMENAPLDTLTLHRWATRCAGDQCAYYQETNEDTNLFSLAEQYGIPVNGAHNALSDAFMTAQVFQRLLVLARQGGIKTVRELLRAGAPA